MTYFLCEFSHDTVVEKPWPLAEYKLNFPPLAKGAYPPLVVIKDHISGDPLYLSGQRDVIALYWMTWCS
jgi:hypothetical protein